MGRISPSPADP